jgi:hypothetical protein
MTGDESFGGQSPYGSARSGTGQGGSARGYEYYQSQVDPEELFRKIFGDAFNRGGFGNHEWTNDSNENPFGQQGITQVHLDCTTICVTIESVLVIIGFNVSRSCSRLQ